MKMLEDRCQTGVEGFDVLIEGGIPRGSLVLLAGHAGSGKTVFSAKYLYHGASKLNEPGIYVSFAENRETFLKNMKRMDMDFEKYERGGTFKFLDLFTVEERGVPDVVTSILEEVSSMKAKRLVIDSFSTLAQALQKPIDSRVVLHTILSKMVRQAGCTTLLVIEMPKNLGGIGLGLEEFVADGVIILRRKWLDGRLLRELEIVKMRGVPIEEPRLVFTLMKGFEAFPPVKHSTIGNASRFQTIRDSPGKFSTGIPDLDGMLGGGYPKGACVLFEVAEKVSSEEYLALSLPAAINSLTQGRGVLAIPCPGMDAEAIGKTALGVYGVTEEEVNSLLRVCELSAVSKDKRKPYGVGFDGKDVETDYREWLRVEDGLVRETGQPVLTMTGLDTLTNLYGVDACERLLSLDSIRVRNHGAVGILVAKPGVMPLVNRISAMAEIHIRLTREHGDLLLYGIKPRSHLFAVEIEAPKGCPSVEMTPIV
jgi:KaiC/GvpD/RAD55 family RecA-like ATPase